MILALNIGNSNITFGGYTPDGKLVFSSRLFADTALSSDELLYKIVNMLALYGAEPQQITAVIFSSVVPALTPRLREALRKMCECQIMEVGPGLKSGVRIRMDNPAQLGGELLCAIVGALQRCTPPCVVVNFDTATTLLAVDSTGALVRNTRTGIYCQANAGAFRSLPQRKVIAALAGIGNQTSSEKEI